MPTRQRTNFFTTKKADDFQINGLTGELNTSDTDLDVGDEQFSDGQNIVPLSSKSLGKRDGWTFYNNFIGSGHGIMGGWSFTGRNGTTEEIVVWNTSLYRNVAGTWTAVTGITFTADIRCDGVYFPSTDTFYITNGTDQVATYQAGSTSGTQSASYPAGKYVTTFQQFLLFADFSGNPDRVKYGDGAGVDTFVNGYLMDMPGEEKIEITGMLNFNNIMLLIFTKRRIYRVQNFAFDGTTSYASQIYELPSDFGAIYVRTVAIINNLVYFLGQSSQSTTSNLGLTLSGGATTAMAVYATDGFSVQDLSYNKIRGTMSLINDNSAATAAGVADGVYYRVYAPDSTNTTNTLGIVYDTSKQRFLSPERRWIFGVVDPAIFWKVEKSGQVTIFLGNQNTGSVYQLHGNAGTYDELPEQFNFTGSNDTAIDANPTKRAAQSFKVSSYNTSVSVPMSQVVLFIKKNAGTTTQLTVRVETNSSGVPSGTLADSNATATIAAITSTSYAPTTVKFSNPFNLLGSTTYWLVIKHTTEGSGNSQYFIESDTSGTNTYGNGNLATFASSAWTSQGAGKDLLFALYFHSAIVAYFVTKGYLPYRGREFSLKRYEIILSNLTVQNTAILIFLYLSANNAYILKQLNTGGLSSAVYGTTAQGGTNTTYGTTAQGGSNATYGGGNNRLLYFGSIDNWHDRIIKVLIGNNLPTQTFEFNQIMFVVAERARNF